MLVLFVEIEMKVFLYEYMQVFIKLVTQMQVLTFLSREVGDRHVYMLEFSWPSLSVLLCMVDMLPALFFLHVPLQLVKMASLPCQSISEVLSLPQPPSASISSTCAFRPRVRASHAHPLISAARTQRAWVSPEVSPKVSSTGRL